MKYILSGGGTGGHVNPALSIGEVIEKFDKDAEIHYVGTPNGIENKLVPAKYPMHHIEIRGLRRSLSPENIRTAILTVKALKKSKKLLRQLRPDAVIGTGGYVCWPICAAAAKLRIPCFLHESNAVPGFAVKMLEKKADVIFVNFEKTAASLKGAKKVVHVGTPLKSGFSDPDRAAARKKLGIEPSYRRIVLSFGGSLGAGFLNEQILGVMESYGAEHPETLFLHAVGARGYESFSRAFAEKGLDRYPNLRYFEYIYEMPTYMAAADLVICRSGALTLSELAALHKPSILIPSPNVTNDQQTKNAKLLSDAGAAVLLRESECGDRTLRETLSRLLDDENTLSAMGERAAAFAVKDAEKAIYDEISGRLSEKPTSD